MYHICQRQNYIYIKKKIEMCLNCIHVFPKLLTSRKITSFKLEADLDSGREDDDRTLIKTSNRHYKRCVFG